MNTRADRRRAERALKSLTADVDDLARRAGLKPTDDIIFETWDTPWSADDREWFRANPERSHRMRFLFDGEVLRRGNEPCPGVTFICLVRQVEPGKRVRKGFWINSEILPVPDAEPVAAALFDASNGEALLNMPALRARIEQYMQLGSAEN